MSRWLAGGLVAALLALTACSPPPVDSPLDSTAENAADWARGRGGAVASAERAATDVGLEILRRGGGAVDAAVAVALALAVVHPTAGNLGGGGFAVVRWGDEVSTLDFRETAPAGADRDMFRAPDGEPIPDASVIGPLAAGVPGSPAGLFELHRRYGTAPWPEVVAPALRLAREGFTVSRRLHAALLESRLELARFPETAEVWLPGGEPLSAGARMTLPDLASTLAAYAERGPEAIIAGPVASAIERAVRAHGGILTAADLSAYRPLWRDPVRLRAFGWELASMPLPSSGGIILGQSVLVLERLGWDGLERDSAERRHLMAEAWRGAYADRFLLGDPATTLADASQLLSAEWVRGRVAGIDRARATPSQEIRAWQGVPAESPGETTHLSVVDGSGNAVALTTTLNGWFGCYLYVPGAGFFLNNEMDDFTTIPERSNLFGLVQGEANTVRPGSRMLSSMTPTIAWRRGEVLALGSPGGGRIPTATTQVLLNLIVDGDPLPRAVERPRLHHQWLPDELRLERAIPPPERAALESLGHRIRVVEKMGEVHVVRATREGIVEAAADGRGPGAAGVVVPAKAAAGGHGDAHDGEGFSDSGR